MAEAAETRHREELDASLAAGPLRRLRILFVVRVPGLLRNFDGALRLIAERGHELEVVVERERERLPGQLRALAGLTERYSNVRVTTAPARRGDAWSEFGNQLRLSLDYLHYLRPQFDEAPDFRRRATRNAPLDVRLVADLSAFRRPRGRRLLKRALDFAERAVPPSEAIVEFVSRREPDIVVVSPLIWFGVPQIDWVRAARACGARTAAAIYSWDNLTSKGAMRDVPDLVLVWNSVQVREAVELHGVPHERLVATGAQNWDWWFEQKPSHQREDFCRLVGVRYDRPYLLYLESSGYVGGERPFLREWIPAMRRLGGPRLREAGVLIRPHPQVSSHDWSVAGVGELDNLAVWPRNGAEPLDVDSRRDLFDSIYHSSVTVGVNTSTFIESAIMDRPSVALLMPRFRKGQVGTVHFHYLLDDNGGPLRAARTFEEQAAAIEQALRGDGRAGPAARTFVERFVRPGPLDQRGADRFVAAIERACEGASRAGMSGVRDQARSVTRRGLAPVARAAAARGRRASSARRARKVR